MSSKEKDLQANQIPVPTTTKQTLKNRRAVPLLAKVTLAAILVFYLASYWPSKGNHGLPGIGKAKDGFHPGRHRKHRYLPPKLVEKKFLGVPEPKSALETARHYAGRAHLAGSPADFQEAKDFLSFLQETLGIDHQPEQPIFSAGSPESRHATLSITKLNKPQAWVDTYYPVLNTPLERNLQALNEQGEVVWEADLDENPDKTDPDAHRYANAVPTFHGLSGAGDVKGELVYVNYGLKEDYDALVNAGVNFTGKIALVKYGGNFRGLKIKRAEELGAAGVLIYSDPKDDGTATVENGYKPYPHGPARNPDSVQRGSVQYLSLYPGDPTTPGYPSYENSTRTDGGNIPKIPSLPISWTNGKKLLDLLNGRDVGIKNWSGIVRLNNQVDTKVTPIWNTIGVIPGWIKDEIVVLGNHRDAWVLGAADPTSGTASIQETIRGFGELLKTGWKPLRTIVFASWDAEEYGLVGSTEWGEDFSDFLAKNAVAYLNVDIAASGSHFGAEASPLLAHVIRRAADDLPHPTRKNATLWDATKDQGDLFGVHNHKSVSVRDLEITDALGVGVLGSGSDYTVFLQRLGVCIVELSEVFEELTSSMQIPSMNHGFSAGQHDPAYHYHSVYDTVRFQEKFADPGFHRQVATAKHLGLVALRITSPVVLPFNTTHYSHELDSYLDDVETVAAENKIEVDLSPLRTSIHALQATSLALDYEKLIAQRELFRVIRQIRRERKRTRRLMRKLWKAYCRWKKRVFGKDCGKHYEGEKTYDELETGKWDGKDHEMDLGWAFAAASSLEEGKDSGHGHCGGHPHWPRWLIFRLIHAVKRVRAVNQKLIAFERGFISEAGLPGREWYRHLGVAPGLWLGYGATTFPALTESITFEMNATHAQLEADRLKAVMDNLIKTIAVEKV
ncbi:Zn-dependent exopeptidase [Marasmius fiardii PR-910]|nr:Zn-dependent exopeptidase [Marasmius fiardii PR-910]